MKINQIYELVNDVSQQMYGENAPTVTNLTDLISMGNEVLSSDKNTEDFCNVLTDRIGRVIISSKPYSSTVNNFLNDSFTFGAILQKIYIEPMDASTDKAWTLQNNNSIDQYVINKPTVKQKLFQGVTVWNVTVTIPDIQLRSAFESATSMTVFIDAIFTAMLNSIEVKLEGMLNMSLSNFIANKIVKHKADGGIGVVNLLELYNAEMSTTLTPTEAMTNTEFLKYSSCVINKFLKRMERMSELFNDEGYKRFTPSDRAKVIMHLDYTSAITTFLESDTYHNEMVKLPNYTEVPYWQGSGTSYDFEDSTSIHVTISDGTKTVEQTGIIGIIADVEAIGLTIYDRRTRSAYNANGEYTNYFNKAEIGYYNDMSENAIVFVIAEEIAEPAVIEETTP